MLTFILCFKTSAQINEINVKGNIQQKRKRLDNVIIKIYNNNGKQVKSLTAGDGEFKFPLDIQKEHILFFIKKGYKTSVFSFSTIVAEKYIEDVWDIHKFNVKMEQEDQKLSKKEKNQVIERVEFDTTLFMFQHSNLEVPKGFERSYIRHTAENNFDQLAKTVSLIVDKLVYLKEVLADPDYEVAEAPPPEEIKNYDIDVEQFKENVVLSQEKLKSLKAQKRLLEIELQTARTQIELINSDKQRQVFQKRLENVEAMLANLEMMINRVEEDYQQKLLTLQEIEKNKSNFPTKVDAHSYLMPSKSPPKQDYSSFNSLEKRGATKELPQFALELAADSTIYIFSNLNQPKDNKKTTSVMPTQPDYHNSTSSTKKQQLSSSLLTDNLWNNNQSLRNVTPAEKYLLKMRAEKETNQANSIKTSDVEEAYKLIVSDTRSLLDSLNELVEDKAIINLNAPSFSSSASKTISLSSHEEKIEYNLQTISEYVANQKPKIIVENGQQFISAVVSYTIEDVNLNPISRYELDNIVRFLKENSELYIEIRGFSDYPTETKNDSLIGHKRASLVKNYLVKNGIDESRLTAKFYPRNYMLRFIFNTQKWHENNLVNLRIRKKKKIE